MRRVLPDHRPFHCLSRKSLPKAPGEPPWATLIMQRRELAMRRRGLFPLTTWDENNSGICSRKRHRRRATMIPTHMKTGLNLTFLSGNNQTFPSLSARFGQLFPSGNVRFRPVSKGVGNNLRLMWEWCTPMRNTPFCAFIPNHRGFTGVSAQFCSGISGNNGE